MAAEDHRKWWLLGAMSGVLGLIVLDETIVTVSLPTISAELGLSVAAAHWVVNAYLLSFTCSVAIAGRYGDRFSRRSYFTIGALLFALASLLAAVAWDGAVLIAARALQGVAAAIVFPTSLALITAAFTTQQRGLAFGYQTMVGGIFMASGPFIGGFLTETVSWRAIFWIGVPVVLGIVAVLWRVWSPAYDPEMRGRGSDGTGQDVLGPVCLVLALLGLVVSIMQGPSWGWGAPTTLGLFVLGWALTGMFVFRALSHPAPLLDLSLMKIPEFSGGVLIFALFQLEKIALFLFVAQFFQDVLGKSPMISGAAVSLAILPTLGTSVLVGKAADRYGSRRVLMTGAACHGAAILLLAIAASYQSFALAVVPLVLWGASMPSLAIPVRRVQMNQVPQHKHGQANGINLTIQMLGGCMGLAICSAFLSETHSYAWLFALVGLATLAVVPIAGRTIERQKRGS